VRPREWNTFQVSQLNVTGVNVIADELRRYCVVNFCTGLVTPSLLPLDSIESTV
jgi:hypothetical protein